MITNSCQGQADWCQVVLNFGLRVCSVYIATDWVMKVSHKQIQGGVVRNRGPRLIISEF